MLIIKKKSINWLSNTKKCMHVFRMGNVCIYSEGFIVTITSEDDS